MPLCVVLALVPVISLAEIAGFPFESPAQEQRFVDLSEKLRCLVCQNQSLADSNAGLAQDLRTELYEQVIQGYTEPEIVEFMTRRYGDFVLYEPRFALKTVMLWLAPFLLFVLGVISLIAFSRYRQTPQENSLSEEDREQLRRELNAGRRTD